MTRMDDQTYMHVPSLRNAIRSGEVSARDVVSEALRRIDERDPSLHCFLSIFHEEALHRADQIDRQLEDGEDPGALTGVPVAIKDNICVKDRTTTAGSEMLQSFEPPYHATVVKNLRQEGAIIVGKTNMDEFAMGSSGENSAFESTRNPWDPDYVPGGSSAGSASAVAARMVPVALGSDTGGSIRQPASLCGATGVKPTYGRVSRYGLIAFASSLDQIGPITKDAQSSAEVLSVIAGPDDRDATSAPADTGQLYTEEPSDTLDDLTVGIPKEFFGDGVDADVTHHVQNGIDQLETLGAEITDISLPHTKYGIPTYYLIATSEASSNLARYDGMHYGARADHDGDLIDAYSATREQAFGDEVKRRILLGTFALSAGYYDAYYKRALKVRRLIKDDFDSAFEDVDVIAGPTSPVPAFPLGEKIDDPLKLYLCDILTVTCNLAGLPGLSIPCGRTEENLPVGLQFLGPPFEEQSLFRVAEAYQSETAFHEDKPEHMPSKK